MVELSIILIDYVLIPLVNGCLERAYDMVPWVLLLSIALEIPQSWYFSSQELPFHSFT